MAIAVAYHFTQIPVVIHKDFPTPPNADGRPFTFVSLTDEKGQKHHLFLPLGCRLQIVEGNEVVSE